VASAEVASRAMSRAALPSQGDAPWNPQWARDGSSSVEHWLFGQYGAQSQSVRPCGRKGGGGDGLAGHAVGS
jgi:hypothetical protein